MSSNGNMGFLDIVWRFKYYLALYIVMVSFGTFAVLYYIGGVPEELQVLDETQSIPPVESVSAPSIEMPTPPADSDPSRLSGEEPVWISIDKIGINVAVNNTAATDLKTLNELLMKGAVRYPGSGTLARGNMFIFGHSTSLRIVNNQAYRAFNKLDKLNIGDIIRIRSTTAEYQYRVISVSLVDADKALVTFNDKRNMVTLSTCNVFGEKQERFVVEAVYISKTIL